MNSAEAILANEELLERTLASARMGYSIYAPPLLEGRIKSQPTNHFDDRMHLALSDIVYCYEPPLQKRTVMLPLVTQRTHKTQAQTEAEETVK